LRRWIYSENFPKVEVASSNPVPRSKITFNFSTDVLAWCGFGRTHRSSRTNLVFSARAVEPNFFQFGHNAEHSTPAIGYSAGVQRAASRRRAQNGQRALCQRGFTGIAADPHVGADEAATLISGALPVRRCHVANRGVVSSPPVTLARWDRQPLEKAPPVR